MKNHLSNGYPIVVVDFNVSEGCCCMETIRGFKRIAGDTLNLWDLGYCLECKRVWAATKYDINSGGLVEAWTRHPHWESLPDGKFFEFPMKLIKI